MYKLVYCVRKRDDIAADKFYRYWLEEHGPLVRSLAEKIGATKYVQSHTTLPKVNRTFVESRGFEEPYDGITEVWFEEFLTTEDSEAATRILADDENKFIDPSRCRVFMTEEHLIFDLEHRKP